MRISGPATNLRRSEALSSGGLCVFGNVSIIRQTRCFGGTAVHVAARVAYAAGAGQVLVSRTVRDLIDGGEFTLTDQGEHALKGVDGEWRLFEVRL